MKALITQEQLKDLLNFDPVTGIFTWKESTHHKEGDACGTKTSHGYLKVSIGGTEYLLHRLAYLWQRGVFPPKHSRISYKALERKACNSNKKSGLRGTYKLKKSNRWLSRIQCDHQQISLGVFDSEQEAHSAYLLAKKQIQETGKLQLE